MESMSLARFDGIHVCNKHSKRLTWFWYSCPVKKSKLSMAYTWQDSKHPLESAHCILPRSWKQRVYPSKNGHLEVPTFLLGPGATSPRGANRESTSRLVIGCYEVQIGWFHKQRCFTPQNGWFIMENPIEMDDFGGYHYFRKHPNIAESTLALAKPQNDAFLILVGFEARQRYTPTKSTASSWPNHSTAHRPFCSKSSHPPPEQKKKNLLDTFHEILLGWQGSLCHGFLKSSPTYLARISWPNKSPNQKSSCFFICKDLDLAKGSEKNAVFKEEKVSLSLDFKPSHLQDSTRRIIPWLVSG